VQGGATDVTTPGEVLRALKRLLIANPHVRNHPVEDVSQALLVGGYLQKKPGPVVVGEALEKLSRESLGTEEDAMANGATQRTDISTRRAWRFRWLGKARKRTFRWSQRGVHEAAGSFDYGLRFA
jgi:hypothetical protein